MAKRRRRKPKAIPMVVENDPDLWRYASVHEALADNVSALARLIRSGAEISQADNDAAASAQSDAASLSESA